MALKEYNVLLHGRTQTTAMYSEDAARKLGLTEEDLVENTPKGRSGRSPRAKAPARGKVAAASANKAAAAADDKSVVAKAKEAAGIDDPDGDDDDQDDNSPDPTGRGF